MTKSIAWLTPLFLLGCATSLDDYQGTGPEFVVEEFFLGSSTAWGMVQDYTGKVNRRFCAELEGRLDDDRLVLDEVFWWDDGEEQYRTWTIDPDTLTGRASDINGEAKGGAEGFAFRWQYQLEVPVGEQSWTFAVDDWIYLLDQDHAFNRSDLNKFGITWGELTLFFQRSPQGCQRTG